MAAKKATGKAGTKPARTAPARTAARGGPVSSEAIEAHLASVGHPLMPLVGQVRAALHRAQPGLEEDLKWNTLSLALRGEHRIAFHLRDPERVRLVFHCGAKGKAPGLRERLPLRAAALLEWASDDRGLASFTSAAELKAAGPALKSLVRAWCKLTVPAG